MPEKEVKDELMEIEDLGAELMQPQPVVAEPSVPTLISSISPMKLFSNSPSCNRIISNVEKKKKPVKAKRLIIKPRVTTKFAKPVRWSDHILKNKPVMKTKKKQEVWELDVVASWY